MLLATGSMGVACGKGAPAQGGGVDAAAAAGSTGSTGSGGSGGANLGTGGTAAPSGAGGAMATGAGGAAGAGGAPSTTANAACPQPSPDAVWTPVAIAPARAPIDVVSSWANSANDAWLIGAGIHSTGPATVAYDDQIQHWNGSQWTTSFDGFPTHILRSVFGFGAADVWATGDVALRWNGSTWTDLSPPAGPRPLRMTPVWGLDANDVWAGNEGAFFHWNGTAWTEATVVPPVLVGNLDLGGIWGATSNDVWALGGFAASHDFLGILRWDGTTWKQLLSPQLTNYTSEEGQVSALWGSAANDIWGVGFSFSGSQIWHYDGTAWTHVPVPSFDGGLSSVWGFCASDVWAVGEELPAGQMFVDNQVGIVLHFDGQAWSRVDLGIPVKQLLTVSGVSSDDLWVGGSTGTMIHRHH